MLGEPDPLSVPHGAQTVESGSPVLPAPSCVEPWVGKGTASVSWPNRKEPPTHVPWGSEWGCVLSLTRHPRITLRRSGSEDSPQRWCLHLVSGEQPKLPRQPRGECGCLPSCQAFHRGRCLAPRLLRPARLRGGGAPVRGVWSLGGPAGCSLATLLSDRRGAAPQDLWGISSSPLAGALCPSWCPLLL